MSAPETGRISHTPGRNVLSFPTTEFFRPVDLELLREYIGERPDRLIQYALWLPAIIFGTSSTFALADLDNHEQSNARFLLCLMCAFHYASRSMVSQDRIRHKTMMYLTHILDPVTKILKGYMVTILENICGGINESKEDAYVEPPMRLAAAGPGADPRQRHPQQQQQKRIDSDEESSSRRRQMTFTKYVFSIARLVNPKLARELHRPPSLESEAAAIAEGRTIKAQTGASANWSNEDTLAWITLNISDGKFPFHYSRAVAWYLADVSLHRKGVNFLSAEADPNSTFRADNVFSLDNAVKAMMRSGVTIAQPNGLLLSRDDIISRFRYQDHVDKDNIASTSLFLGNQSIRISNEDAYFSTFRAHVMPHIERVFDTSTSQYREFEEKRRIDIGAGMDETTLQETIKREYVNMLSIGTNAPNSLDGFILRNKPALDKTLQTEGWAAWNVHRRAVIGQFYATFNTEVYQSSSVAGYAREFDRMMNSSKKNFCGHYLCDVEAPSMDILFDAAKTTLAQLEVGLRVSTGHIQTFALIPLLLLDSSRDDEMERTCVVFAGPPAISKSNNTKIICWLAIPGTVFETSRQTTLADTTSGPKEAYIVIYDEANPTAFGVQEGKTQSMSNAVRNGGGNGSQSELECLMLKLLLTNRIIYNRSVVLDEKGQRNEVSVRAPQYGSRHYNVNVSPCFFLPAMLSRVFIIEMMKQPVNPNRDITNRRMTPSNPLDNEDIKRRLKESTQRLQLSVFLWNTYMAHGSIRPPTLRLAQVFANRMTMNMSMRGISNAREPRRFPKYMVLVRALVMWRASILTWEMGLGRPDPTRPHRAQDVLCGEHFFVANTALSVFAFEIAGLWGNPVVRLVIEAVYRLAQELGGMFSGKKHKEDAPPPPKPSPAPAAPAATNGVLSFFTGNDPKKQQMKAAEEEAKRRAYTNPRPMLGVYQKNEYICIENIFVGEDQIANRQAEEDEAKKKSSANDGSYQPTNRPPVVMRAEGPRVRLLAEVLINSYMRNETPDVDSACKAIYELMFGSGVAGERPGHMSPVMFFDGANCYIHKDFVEYYASDPEEAMIRMLYASEKLKRRVLRFKPKRMPDETYCYSRFEEMTIGGSLPVRNDIDEKLKTNRFRPKRKDPEKNVRDSYDKFRNNHMSAEEIKCSHEFQREYDDLVEAATTAMDKCKIVPGAEEEDSDAEFGAAGSTTQHEAAKKAIISDTNSRYSKIATTNSVDRSPLDYKMANPDFADRDHIQTLVNTGSLTRSAAKRYSTQEYLSSSGITDESIQREHITLNCGVPESSASNHFSMPIQVERCIRVYYECQYICENFSTVQTVLLNMYNTRISASLSAAADEIKLPSEGDYRRFVTAGMKAVVSLARLFCVYMLHDALIEDLTPAWVQNMMIGFRMIMLASDTIDPLRMQSMKDPKNPRGVKMATTVYKYCIACLEATQHYSRDKAKYTKALEAQSCARAEVQAEFEQYFSTIACHAANSTRTMIASFRSFANDQKIREIDLDCSLVSEQHRQWPISAESASKIVAKRMRESVWHPVMKCFEGKDPISDGEDCDPDSDRQRSASRDHDMQVPSVGVPRNPPPLTSASASASASVRMAAASVAKKSVSIQLPHPKAMSDSHPTPPGSPIRDASPAVNFGAFNKHISERKEVFSVLHKPPSDRKEKSSAVIVEAVASPAPIAAAEVSPAPVSAAPISHADSKHTSITPLQPADVVGAERLPISAVSDVPVTAEPEGDGASFFNLDDIKPDDKPGDATDDEDGDSDDANRLSSKTKKKQPGSRFDDANELSDDDDERRVRKNEAAAAKKAAADEKKAAADENEAIPAGKKKNRKKKGSKYADIDVDVDDDVAGADFEESSEDEEDRNFIAPSDDSDDGEEGKAADGPPSPYSAKHPKKRRRQRDIDDRASILAFEAKREADAIERSYSNLSAYMVDTAEDTRSPKRSRSDVSMEQAPLSDDKTDDKDDSIPATQPLPPPAQQPNAPAAQQLPKMATAALSAGVDSGDVGAMADDVDRLAGLNPEDL